MPIDPLLKPVLATFVAEAGTIQQRITRDLLTLERETGDQALNEAQADLLRGLHTLKGTAGTFGIAELSGLAHRMEDLAARARSPDGRIPEVAADALLRGIDAFVDAIGALARDDGQLPDLSGALSILERAQRGEAAEPSRDAAEFPRLADDKGEWRVSEKHISFLSTEIERLRELRLGLEDSAARVAGTLAVGRRRTEDALGELAAAAITSRTASETAAEIIAGLEDGLRLLCTVPVASVLEPLHRLVRDDCRQSGKRATLSIVGGEISLDRRLLEALRGPLVHLVRNAVDHGIEMPDVRDRAGKNLEGAISLRFELQGSLLTVEVSDDGAGLDSQLIGEEAVRRGLVDHSALAAMERQALLGLIFEPGFSTRHEVSETSGRGAGLDVVRTQLAELHGYVEVLSERGQGSRFVLTLPTGIGSSPVLVVAVEEHRIGIPLVSVESVVAARPENVDTTHARTSLKYGKQLVSVRDLGALLGLRAPCPLGPKQPLCVVHSHAQRAAIAVDAILGDRDLAIRPLPSELRQLVAYQGAATMANGEAMLVMRPEWMVDQEYRESARAHRCLVVDDSIAARAMHRTVLESGGFVVHTAASGQEALEKLGSVAYDAVVCDLHMDGMDGFALVTAMREDPKLSVLPVVVVSMSEDEETERQAIRAGADAFITKRDCVAGRLLSELESTIARKRSA
jgi:two-component system, chemotaxis family, sensor kinase CheA